MACFVSVSLDRLKIMSVIVENISVSVTKVLYVIDGVEVTEKESQTSVWDTSN